MNELMNGKGAEEVVITTGRNEGLLGNMLIV